MGEEILLIMWVAAAFVVMVCLWVCAACASTFEATKEWEVDEFARYAASLEDMTLMQLKQQLKEHQRAKREALRRMPDMRLKNNKWLHGGAQAYIVEIGRKHDKYIECIERRLAVMGSEIKPAKDAPRKGYVYFIGAYGKVKIGRTNSLDRRLAELQTGCPTKIELLHSIETDRPSQLEAKLHRLFAGKRSTGEWFDLQPQDLRYVIYHVDYSVYAI